MWIICLADDSNEMSSIIFSDILFSLKNTKKKKKKKKNQNKKKKIKIKMLQLWLVL